MNRLRSLLIAVLAVTPLVGAQQQSSQKPPAREVPTFRSSVRAIQIDAVVTDEAGNPVSGLTADDFEITERGQIRQISTFDAVDLPIEQQRPDLADSDVVTNEGEGRMYLIVLDAMTAETGMKAKRMMRTFFAAHFGPRDVAAVMLLDRGHTQSGQDFTSNRRLLIKGVDSFVEADPAAPGAASPLNSQTSIGTRNRMARLRELVDFLVKIPGRRKAMLLLTEAIGFDATDFADYRGATMSLAAEDAHAAMTAATRGNVAVYPINPAGLSSESDLSALERLESTMELRSLGAATGGFAHVNSNNFNETFTRLVREQSVYYMLGFDSAQGKDDGLFVPIRVTVKRPGLRVHAREGYLAPFKGKDSFRPVERRADVGAALASPVPAEGVTLRGFAAPFKGRGRNANVAVALQLDPATLGLDENRDGGLSGAVDLRLVSTDVRSRVSPQTRHTPSITIPAERRNETEGSDIFVLANTELPPGRHQLRVAAGAGGRGGSIVYDLDVPDFTKRQLSMSGVVLRADREADLVLLPQNDPLRDLATRAPTTTRVFTAEDTVFALAEIYDPRGGAHTIDVSAELRGESGVVIPVATLKRSSEDVRRAGGILRFEAPLPLANATPDRYVLHVQARSSAGGDPVARAIPLRVR